MSFDRRLVGKFRGSASSCTSLLFSDVAALVSDRAAFLFRDFYSSVLIAGCRGGALARALVPILSSGSKIYQCDISSEAFLDKEEGYSVVADDEALPFRSESFDCVISNLTLHNVNDLEGTISRIRSMLRDGGLFMGATFGSGTLRNIKKAMLMAEGNRVVPRIQPFMPAYEIITILQSCGFRDVVIDVEMVFLGYRDMYHLFRDLKNMGEGNTIRRGYEPLGRDVMRDAWDIYKQLICYNEEDKVPVGYEIVIFKGSKKGE